ncbi:MAG TPA: hypothetical protein VKT78_04175 [Fimbriimonadaceae bacterium]|nr:hypothetical protein [Fimbriimonadaceae bacterium]
MALLAEELVEEWLNRQGYFTLRGAKIGVHEMDLLAVRFCPDGDVECRHVEVQVSVNPQSYLTRLSRADQRETGRAPTSKATRTGEQIGHGVDEWVAKKFGHGGKRDLLQQLAPGNWTRELVVHKVYEPVELDLLRDRGVRIHFLADLLSELAHAETVVKRASGGDFLELVLLGSELGKAVDSAVIAEVAATLGPAS